MHDGSRKRWAHLFVDDELRSCGGKDRLMECIVVIRPALLGTCILQMQKHVILTVISIANWSAQAATCCQPVHLMALALKVKVCTWKYKQYHAICRMRTRLSFMSAYFAV